MGMAGIPGGLLHTQLCWGLRGPGLSLCLFSAGRSCWTGGTFCWSRAGAISPWCHTRPCSWEPSPARRDPWGGSRGGSGRTLSHQHQARGEECGG